MVRWSAFLFPPTYINLSSIFNPASFYRLTTYFFAFLFINYGVLYLPDVFFVESMVICWSKELLVFVLVFVLELVFALNLFDFKTMEASLFYHYPPE